MTKKQTNQPHHHDHNHDHHHQHEHQTVTLTLEDDTQLICPIIDRFKIETQEYIVLLHPIDETALLYQFTQHSENEIEINRIENSKEFKKVSQKFLELQEQYDQEEQEYEDSEDKDSLNNQLTPLTN